MGGPPQLLPWLGGSSQTNLLPSKMQRHNPGWQLPVQAVLFREAELYGPASDHTAMR